VLLAAWCGLRRGEVVAPREDIDLEAGTVTVRHNRVELLESPSAAFDADPKTDAGKRTVAVPPHVLPFFQKHMAKWAGSDRVFVGRDGQTMRGDAIRQAFTRARRKVGMPGFRFHDRRHTGQTLAASAAQVRHGQALMLHAVCTRADQMVSDLRMSRFLVSSRSAVRIRSPAPHRYQQK